MKSLFKNNRGATAVEFALVALPMLWFILGIMQIGYLVWVANLLHVSVDEAARWGGIKSMTAPCAGTDMVSAAKAVFAPLSGATFTANTCSAGSIGVIGTYTASIAGIKRFTLTFTAKSCYPTVT